MGREEEVCDVVEIRLPFLASAIRRLNPKRMRERKILEGKDR